MIALAAGILAATLFSPGVDTQEIVRVRVTQRSATGVYLDAGRGAGLTVGDEGVLERDGVEIGRVVLRSVAGSTSFGETVEILGSVTPVPGDQVRFRVTKAEASILTPPILTPPSRTPPSGDPKAIPTEDEGFVPLLERPSALSNTGSKDVFHGGVRLGTSVTKDGERNLDYLFHRVSTWGSGERLGGGPWSVEWDLDAYQRDGDGYDGDSDQGDLKVRADALVLRRHLEDGGVVGFGRFLPLALPDLGRVDGVYGEIPTENGLRLGALAGFKPDRDDLGFDRDQPMVAAYGAFDRDLDDRTQIWMAAGAMATWFEGAADEHALLFSTRVRRDRSWFYLSSQVDLYSGGEEVRSGAGLTRLHLSGSTPLSEDVDVSAGYHQYQLADTESLRTVFPDDRVFGRGHRRASVGLRERLPNEFSLEQELAHIDGAGTSGEFQWTLRARKSGLPAASSLDVSVYRLTGLESSGLGGSLGLFTMPHERMRLQVLLDHQRVEFEGGPTFSASTLSGFVDWLATDRLTISTRVGTAFGDEVQSVFLDLSGTLRF